MEQCLLNLSGYESHSVGIPGDTVLIAEQIYFANKTVLVRYMINKRFCKVLRKREPDKIYHPKLSKRKFEIGPVRQGRRWYLKTKRWIIAQENNYWISIIQKEWFSSIPTKGIWHQIKWLETGNIVLSEQTSTFLLDEAVGCKTGTSKRLLKIALGQPIDGAKQVCIWSVYEVF